MHSLPSSNSGGVKLFLIIKNHMINELRYIYLVEILNLYLIYVSSIIYCYGND